MNDNAISLRLFEDELRSLAIKKIAQVYKVKCEDLSTNMKFGADLKNSKAPDGFFKKLQYYLNHQALESYQIEYDIEDVAECCSDKDVAEENAKIITVGDYCDLMVRCYKHDPDTVLKVLKREPY